MAKKHYIDVLLDKAREAVEDGVFGEQRTRLRDDVVGLIEREKEEAIASYKKRVGELQREAGELRVQLRRLESDTDHLLSDD